MDEDLSHYDLVQSLIRQRDSLIQQRDTYYDALRFISRMNYSAPAEVAARALQKFSPVSGPE